MKELKALFQNSKIALGVAIGSAIGYLVPGELGSVLIFTAVMVVIAVIVENIFFRK